MFSLHNTNAIEQIAHERVDRLHHEARVASSLSSLHASFRIRIRIANVARCIAAWIEPQPAAVCISALQRPQYGSD